MDTEAQLKALAKLREPFPAHQISKLPKGTKAQNECDPKEKINCQVCGGWHHPKVIHLDYVGHAALTDRLLDADPLWYWEPVAFHEGLPAFDKSGGLWIRLYVAGHSRLGYGHAASASFKDIGAREKEVIGDALRNAAMRFGAALDLWHKGDLHVDDEQEKPKPDTKISASAEIAKQVPAARHEALLSVVNSILEAIDAQQEQAAHDMFYGMGDQEEQVFVWNKLPAPVRKAIKNLHSEQKE